MRFIFLTAFLSLSASAIAAPTATNTTSAETTLSSTLALVSSLQDTLFQYETEINSTLAAPSASLLPDVDASESEASATTVVPASPDQNPINSTLANVLDNLANEILELAGSVSMAIVTGPNTPTPDDVLQAQQLVGRMSAMTESLVGTERNAVAVLGNDQASGIFTPINDLLQGLFTDLENLLVGFELGFVAGSLVTQLGDLLGSIL